MHKFEIESISSEGTELDESRLVWIAGGKPGTKSGGIETGCIPDLVGSIRADDPILG